MVLQRRARQRELARHAEEAERAAREAAERKARQELELKHTQEIVSIVASTLGLSNEDAEQAIVRAAATIAAYSKIAEAA